ncbi:uridine kinase family protein [Phytohabitans kaempferiae]|uniref:Uridine kinase n=1 Tax=Phytohabitans kaempferiae TaxID=1620943 RepID=A0ABV6MCX2_9ACTN
MTGRSYRPAPTEPFEGGEWGTTIAEIAREVWARPPRLGETRLVAVDGPSGAGKTTFAGRLAGAIGPGTPTVHTDDLLDGWGDQVTFWPRLEEWVLAPLREGRAGRYRPYDWEAGRFAPEWREVAPAPVVLLEGVTAARAEIRPELTLAVFLTAPLDLRIRRTDLRDGGRLASYLEEWRRGEEAHFAADATAHHADVVLDTTT